MSRTSLNRRRFLTTSAISTAAVAVPTVVPAHVFGKAPSNTLRIGCIGTGRMGHADMKACLHSGLEMGVDAHVVAVCDVDRNRALQAKLAVETAYADLVIDRAVPRVDTYEDYRELLARDDIDGVTVSAPDHWHALVAIVAAESGKDVYLQKPLTYTIAEGQKLVQAVRTRNVILQTGSQQRSSRDFRRACELVRNGSIGKLHTIRVQLPTDKGIGKSTPMPIPKQLNYDMWLGPAPRVPYTEHRVHPQTGFSRPGWLQIETYCRGMITGWGAHMFDIAQWGHGSDGSGPIEMEATGQFPDRGLFDVHTDFRASGHYADGVKLLARSGTPAGVTFVGDSGSISVTRSSLEAEPVDVLRQPPGDGQLRLYHSNNHMRNFLQCMRSRKDPICPVEVGHRSNTICVIAHLAMKLGRKLHWDPHTERFVNDQVANDLLDYDHRQPWTI